MKARVKELGIANARVNTAGCLDRCELGPCAVIYPDGAWYRIGTTADVDAVLQSHVLEGKKVTELLLPDRHPSPWDGSAIAPASEK